MIIHIVKMNETLDDILANYHVKKEEVIEANRHMTDINHIQSGTMIKIPLLNSETIQTLDSVEPLITNLNNEIIEEEMKKENETIKQNNEFKGVRFIRPKGFFDRRREIYPHYESNEENK